jgi:hypothetical protein
MMAMTFLAVVIAAKFLSEWNTAWSVGSFFCGAGDAFMMAGPDRH